MINKIANGNDTPKKLTQTPKKFLFVTIDSLIGDIAWRIVLEGHEVKYYVKNPEDKEVGAGFVPMVDDWKKEVDWADIIVFDDVLGQGTIAEKLRKQGKLVVGGTPYTDKLEDDRDFGQDELKSHGIPILMSKTFTNFDEAIQFVKDNPGKYVLKPCGEAANLKGLLFIGEEDDGRDVIQVLTDYSKAWAKKIPAFQLQKRIYGVEIAVGAFFNGKQFIYPINVNFEHKKLFPGNLGPSTGEMGCYDDKTEVLTGRGWHLFQDLTTDDTICTLQSQTHEIEYHKPYSVVAFAHHKELISIKNQTLDICVTPDHNMYVQSQQAARNHRNQYSFVKARDLEHQSMIPRTGTWNRADVAVFTLPGVTIGHYEGSQVVYQESPPIDISMDAWAAFLGIWLADGSVSGNDVVISQKVPEKTAKIEQLLAQLPFTVKRYENMFVIHKKQLASFMKQFGKAATKHVPDFIKQLSKRQIEIFLDWFCLGDGTVMRSGHRIFYTISKDLADDVQELLLKIGRVGVVKQRVRTGKIWIVDHYANRTPISYEVHERVQKLNSWIDRRDTKTVPYTGKVYCATVPNHIMYIRRNGKPYWCGNTLMFWSGPNKLFNQTLKKFEQKLADEGYVGYIDLNCIVNSKGIYPIEFTSRFGYPCVFIQEEGMISPMGDFLYELALGGLPKLKVHTGFQIGVRIVVPPFPFSDKETFNVKSKDSVIFFKKPVSGVHIEDVKLVNGEWVVTGTAGVVLTVCGTGSTLKQAQAQVYQRIKNISIPHMYYRDDIGDRWVDDSDKLHSWGYLREQ